MRTRVVLCQRTKIICASQCCKLLKSVHFGALMVLHKVKTAHFLLLSAASGSRLSSGQSCFNCVIVDIFFHRFHSDSFQVEVVI